MGLEKLFEGFIRRTPKAEQLDLRSEFAPQIARIIFAKAAETPQDIWRSGISFINVKIFAQAQENGATVHIACTIKKGEFEDYFNGSETELAQTIVPHLDPGISGITSDGLRPGKKSFQD